MPYEITDGCVGCGACIAVCPLCAITESSTKPVIDKNICIMCGNCEAECPVGAVQQWTEEEEE